MRSDSDDEALNAAITAAQALLNDPDNASVTAVVSALLDLSEAMQALNTDESTDALRADVQATIDFIKEHILTNVDNVRPGKVQALKDAVAAAEELLASDPDANGRCAESSEQSDDQGSTGAVGDRLQDRAERIDRSGKRLP